VIIQAEAGVGKSTLAARLAGTRPWPCHFNRLPGGRSPEAARRSLAAQLIADHRLTTGTLGHRASRPSPWPSRPSLRPGPRPSPSGPAPRPGAGSTEPCAGPARPAMGGPRCPLRRSAGRRPSPGSSGTGCAAAPGRLRARPPRSGARRRWWGPGSRRSRARRPVAAGPGQQGARHQLHGAVDPDRLLGLRRDGRYPLGDPAHYRLGRRCDPPRLAEGVIALDDEDGRQHGARECSHYGHDRPRAQPSGLLT
jgi:hypothetical protein